MMEVMYSYRSLVMIDSLSSSRAVSQAEVISLTLLTMAASNLAWTLSSRSNSFTACQRS